MSRAHPATLRTALAGFPVAKKPVLATLGTDPALRMVERFEEIGDAFDWCVANREPRELTVVQGFGKRWRYVENAKRRGDAWVVM